MKVPSDGSVVLLHRVCADEVERGPYALMTQAPDELGLFLEENRSAPGGSWDEIVEGKVGSGWSLLTFDDGFKDTIDVALPLIERFERHMIVFVTVAFVSAEFEPFQVYAARMLEGLDSIQIDGERFELDSDERYELAWRTAFRGMDRGTMRKRQRRLTSILQENSLSHPVRSSGIYLDWSEVKELARHPLVTIGAHSWSHPKLNRIPPWLLKRELYDARKYIEQRIAKSVSLLAYPHGAENLLVRASARAAGYHFAFGTHAAPLIRSRAVSRMAIPRVEL